MNERAVKFRVGVVVLATMLITAILILLFSDSGFHVRPQRTVYIKFTEAPGVTVGTPVRKSGILIGRVRAIEFDDEGGVIVTAGINGDIQLRRSEVCRIKGTILGDAVLEFVPSGDMAKHREFIEDGEVLTGVVVTSPLDMFASLEGTITGALASVGSAGTQVNELAGRINSLLADNDEQVRRIMAKTETALDSFNRTMVSLDDTLGDDELRDNLKRSLADLPKLMDETRATMQRMQSVATNADANLENLKGFTGPLGERGSELVDKVEQTVTQLDALLEQFVKFGEGLNNSEGSLGQLVHNPELYNRLNHAAANIEEVSTRLRPIIEDVRIFTDKIARDPGRIGVSGAIRKPSGVK